MRSWVFPDLHIETEWSIQFSNDRKHSLQFEQFPQHIQTKHTHKCSLLTAVVGNSSEKIILGPVGVSVFHRMSLFHRATIHWFHCTQTSLQMKNRLLRGKIFKSAQSTIGNHNELVVLNKFMCMYKMINWDTRNDNKQWEH
jgi:hypothetical protein